MRVVPKRWLWSERGEIRVHVQTLGDALFVECEVIEPKSWQGRTVDLYLNRDDVVALLLELRDSARRTRSEPDIEHAPDLRPPPPPGLGDWIAETMRRAAEAEAG